MTVDRARVLSEEPLVGFDEAVELRDNVARAYNNEAYEPADQWELVLIYRLARTVMALRAGEPGA